MSYFYVAFVILFLIILNKCENKTKERTTKDFSSTSVLNATKFCPKDDTLYIRGVNVKIGDFLGTNSDVNNLCSNKVSLKFLYVFALGRLVIDVNVNVTGSHLLTFFIAPIWVIKGNRQIAADGHTGEYLKKARDGDSNRMNGEDGKPGQPGGPGGLFFGIGEKFINGENLEITTNGGVGGAGQDGGDGFSQVQGRYVNKTALGKIWCGLYYDICRSEEKQYQLLLQDNQGNYTDFICQGVYERKKMEMCSYKIFGLEGAEGGRGGNGGRGGKGGLPGRVQLVELKSPSRISTNSAFGKNGKDGKGGIGGKSGNKGYNVIYEDVHFLAPPKIYLELYEPRFAPNGSDGYNTAGYNHDPVKADVLKTSQIIYTLNKYKSWVRNSSDRSSVAQATMFYKHFDETPYLRDLYNIKDLLSEIKGIDEETVVPNSTVDFLPVYESLLNRILYCLEFLSKDMTNEESKNILKVVYSDILSRIYNNKQQSETYLAIEIPPYFENIKKVLKNVSSLVDKKTDFNSIVKGINELNQYKENYEVQLDNKIKQLRNDMSVIAYNETISNEDLIQMEIIINDIIRFKNKPVSYEQELLVQEQKLHNSLLLRANFYIVKLINRTWSILIEFAELVISLVEVRAKVPKLLALGDVYETKTKFAQSVLPVLKKKIEEIKSEEITQNTLLLKSFLNITIETPNILSDVRNDVLFVYEKLQSYTRFSTLTALRSDLLKVVEIKRNELSIFNVSPGKYSNPKEYLHVLTARSVFINLRRIIKIATLNIAFVDVYLKFEHNSTQLDVVVEYSKKATTQLQSAKRHESVQSTIVYHLLQRIEDMVLDLSGNPGTVLNVENNVFQWNIPRVLAELEKTAREFIKLFKTDDYLVHTLRNLVGESTKLIAVFEGLNSFIEQKQLDNHVKDISSAVKKGIKFTDVEFSKHYEEVKSRLGSNLILQHYKKAVDTFKQFVFPIMHVYIDDIILPNKINTNYDISRTISIAITQIDKMLVKVKDYKNLVLNGDGIIGRKAFGGWQNNSLNPFFVWKNELHKDMITKLLSGDEIILNADIKLSDMEENAIKLNSLHFVFKAKDEAMQSKFNELFLGNFDVYQEHLGNSQYRYGDKVYLITSQPLEMFYTPDIVEDGEAMPSFGGAYGYLMEGNIMLSPYSSWKVYLTAETDFTFDDLLVFKDYLDLEMIGNGYFVKEDTVNHLDLRVNQYYKPMF